MNWGAVASLIVGSLVGWGLVVNASASWLSWQGYLLGPLGGREGDWAGANIGILLAMVVGFDGFREVINNYGYRGGDEILADFAVKLRQVCPMAATLYRFEGDEFAVLIPDGSRNQAGSVFEALRQAALTALPYRLLCRPDCKGLCPICGVDRNETDCSCEMNTENPFAILRKLDLPEEV